VDRERPTLPDRAGSALIRFEGVSRTFPRRHVRAIRNVSLSVERGDYLAVTGPSGSGKSTLLYLASGLDHPDEGFIQFEGMIPKSQAEWARLRATRIGFVFQQFHLIAGLTAAENVELPMFGVVRREKERQRRTAILLDRVAMGHRMKHKISELSGGEAQRVAIARALANSPSVILADEPTGNLDSQTAGGIFSLLQDVHRREKATLVIVTHDERASERARRVIRLLDGEIAGELCREAEA
jgi:ABC-type lipoprotein export system ATPase subunit